MTDPIVRPMTAEDRAAVIELLAGSDPWKRLGYQAGDWDIYFTPLPQGRDSYVVDQNGNVAGIAIVRQKFLLGDYLELLAVADWARGKGLGGKLLGHIEPIVFGRATNLFACVSDFNAQARAFYKKHGYQEIGPMPNFLIPGSAEILLRKTAGPARKS
ncbi:MAG: GNAT family N-acetyltransferase [Nitrospirae bacterium]|nr:GNAT family N-acetyltransferase [Nitrospirota bacterium]MDE3039840.1 GNAT family N-acetyltransferase [Nitrospirota bacterium]MDE3219284.1 GNAT family N-acetyltransferase [Nitrospirota bacterium]